MSTSLCNNFAAFRFTWPGRDESHICIECAPQLERVCNAMGLYVQLVPLSGCVTGDHPTCKQHISDETRAARAATETAVKMGEENEEGLR